MRAVGMRSSASAGTSGEPPSCQQLRAAAYAVFLVVLGVPSVLPLAILVILGGFIPYVGPFLAMAAVLLGALGTVGPQATLVLLVLMLVANGIVNNFLRPIVYGRSVHLHPAIIIIAIPAGAAIAGIVGVFAAIPVVAFAVAIGGALVDALEPDAGPRPERLLSRDGSTVWPSGAGACSPRLASLRSRSSSSPRHRW